MQAIYSEETMTCFLHQKESTSTFVFGNNGNQQTFNHFVKVEGKWHNCNTCRSSIDADESLSQHWLKRQPQLSKEQQAMLDIINERNIETFFFCDESGKDNSQDFLSETYGRSVPELLRWMFHNGAHNVKFSLACYVNVAEEVLIFQSGTLAVHQHYDIEESVSVVSDTLSQRIKDYLDNDDYSISRMRLQVKCFKEDMEASDLVLPIKLRYGTVSTRSHSSCSESEMASECDDEHGVNLYGLQQCQTTKELYVVPYHISELQQQPSHNFLVLNNIKGQFLGLHELPTPDEAFPFVSLRTIHCFRCRTEFKSRSRLHIHQQLRCGEDFSVSTLHPDMVEVYEQCLPISRSDLQYSCYGIIKPKTIKLGKSTVPCVFISNSDNLFISYKFL